MNDAAFYDFARDFFGVKRKPAQTAAKSVVLHTRQAVETSDADAPINRYRVPGGWLYHAVTTRGAEAVSVALCFVPDDRT